MYIGMLLKELCAILKGTMNYGLHYTGYPSVLEGYSDANWISDADEMKATSGYVFTTWWWCCFLEVLQANDLNEIDNGSRINSIRHIWW